MKFYFPFLFLCSFLNRNVDAVDFNVDWFTFLHRHDMHWEWFTASSMTECPGNWSTEHIPHFESGYCFRPNSWTVAPFLGNGLLGAIVTTPSTSTNSSYDWIDFSLGRSDAYDTRPFFLNTTTQPRVNQRGNIEYVQGMLMIGQIRLELKQRIKSGTMRLNLYDAELTGNISLIDNTSLSFRAFVNGDNLEHPTLAIQVDASSTTFSFSFNPEIAQSARNITSPQTYYNPPAPIPVQMHLDDNTSAHMQPLLGPPLGGGGSMTTVWSWSSNWLLATVAYSTVDNNTLKEAQQTIKEAKSAGGYDTLLQRHADWWHEWYNHSFVDAGPASFSSYYWIQQYKYASASHPNAPPLSNLGPWVQPTGWPGFWNDMNLETDYWAPLTANRLELSNALLQHILRAMPSLIATAPLPFQNDSAAMTSGTSLNFEHSCYWVTGDYYPKKQPPPTDPSKWFADCHPMNETTGAVIGNLLWTCFDLFQHASWLPAADMDAMLVKVLPILERAVNLYLRMARAISGWLPGHGLLHTPFAFSPEYKTCSDCNYDIALLRWGLQILSKYQGRLVQPTPDYSRALKDLVDAPVDVNQGWLIGAGVSLSSGHRHYSHLFPFFPLRLVRWNDGPQSRLVIQRSVDHWFKLSHHSGFTGFSYVALGLMNQWMGRLDASLGNISQLLFNNSRPGGIHTPTTMYYERWNAGPAGRSMCMETPLSFSHWYQEACLQSWEGIIRVFPGIPSSWSNASFHNLRAQGGILISAVRELGRTSFIELLLISSQIGNGSATVHAITVIDGDGNHYKDMNWVANGAGVQITPTKIGDMNAIEVVGLHPNQPIVLTRRGEQPELKIELHPVKEEPHYWGYGPGGYLNI